jgi:hypothetical protein
LAVAVFSVAIAYAVFKKNSKKDIQDEGKEKGARITDIEYIKRRTDDIFLEQRDTNRKLDETVERVVRVEESTKSAHHRIDEVCERINKGGKN